MSEDKKSFTEEIKTSAENLLETITDLIREGNVRHVLVRDTEGDTVLEFPVTIGVFGIIIAPFLAAIGALMVVAADYTIVVTRDPKDDPTSEEPVGT